MIFGSKIVSIYNAIASTDNAIVLADNAIVSIYNSIASTNNAIVLADNAIVSTDNSIVSTDNAIVSTDNAIASTDNSIVLALPNLNYGISNALSLDQSAVGQRAICKDKIFKTCCGQCNNIFIVIEADVSWV